MNTVNRKKRMLVSLLVAATGLGASALSAQDDKPAQASVPEQTFHGTVVRDPYRWMEDNESEAVRTWAADQTERTTKFTAGADYDAMSSRILELSDFDLRYTAKLRGDRLFFLKRPKGGAPVELRMKHGDQVSLILSSDQVPDATIDEAFIGGRNFAGAHWPDRAGNMVAYGYNDGTSQAGRIRIIDANSGLHLEEQIDDVGHGLLTLDWGADGRGFYYTKAKSVPAEDGSGERVQPLGLYYHQLGTGHSADREIIAQPDGDRMIYTPAVSSEGQYLVVQKQSGLAKRNTYLVFETKDLSARPLELFSQLDGRFTFLGNRGDRLFFQTFYQAPNGRVVYIDLAQPETVVEVIPESEQPMLVGSSVGGDIVGYADGHILLGYLKDGVPEVSVFTTDGVHKYVLDVPTGQTIWGGIQGTANEHVISISTLSVLSPAVISRVDVRTGAIRREFETAIPIDVQDFIVERVFFESRDGTRVPMSVVRHKDTNLDGKNPALIYGYGMHSWVSFLFYQPHILHWLELGGVYAMPAIRGGGEYGEAWHQAGIRTNRQNAVDDFVYAGRWLIKNGYTRASLLAANGSSASGPLAGIVAVRYGDVFAASTVDYPVADMVRAPLFGNGALMTEEYGRLDDPEEARSIINQSPYHQAQTPACRIPTLVMVGSEDRVVLPFHGYKLAAALQETQTCDAPILFRLMPETGHNYGNTPERLAENAAVHLMFLKRVLNF